METRGKCTVVYILECSDGTLYTGWTDQLDNRLAAHNCGRGPSIRVLADQCVWFIVRRVPDRSAALRREAQIKRLTRSQKLSLIHEASLE